MYSFHLTISAAAKKRGTTHSRARTVAKPLRNKKEGMTAPMEVTVRPVLLLPASPPPSPRDPPSTPITPRPTVCVEGLPEGGWSRRVARVEYPDLPWVPSCIDSPGFRPRDDKQAWRMRLEREAAEDADYGGFDDGYYDYQPWRPPTPPFDATVRHTMALEMGELVKRVAAAPEGETRNAAILELLDYMLDHVHMRAFFDSTPTFCATVQAKMQEFRANPLATEEIRERAEQMLERLSW